MANKYSKGEFTPENWAKYIGDRSKKIIYRSSWEYTMMRLFDRHPNVTGWASEPIEIPYKNPLTQRWTVYVPDFIVVYADKNGKPHAEMMEVKPLRERPDYQKGPRERLSEATRLKQAVNMAKWAAASAYCARHGMKFSVASEDEMFKWERNKK